MTLNTSKDAVSLIGMNQQATYKGSVSTTIILLGDVNKPNLGERGLIVYERTSHSSNIKLLK